MDEIIEQMRGLLLTDAEQNEQIKGRAARIKALVQDAKDAISLGNTDEALRLIDTIRVNACWIEALEDYDVSSVAQKKALCKKMKGKC